VEVDSKAKLLEVYQVARKFNMRTFILGGGSNVIITSRYNNLLVILNRYVEKKRVYENSKTVEIFISSGYPVSKLVQETVEVYYLKVSHFLRKHHFYFAGYYCMK